MRAIIIEECLLFCMSLGKKSSKKMDFFKEKRTEERDEEKKEGKIWSVKMVKTKEKMKKMGRV